MLRVPLRLAITEHAGDEESNLLVYPGAAWSVRLASKLLRMCRAGSASPWAPYLRVGEVVARVLGGSPCSC